MGVCNCSMFCCMLLYIHSSIAIILMGKRELVALLNLSSWCLVMVEWLFLAVPRGCLRFVIVVFPDHTYLLFFLSLHANNISLYIHLNSCFREGDSKRLINHKLSCPLVVMFLEGFRYFCFGSTI